jgi:integrase
MQEQRSQPGVGPSGRFRAVLRRRGGNRPVAAYPARAGGERSGAQAVAAGEETGELLRAFDSYLGRQARAQGTRVRYGRVLAGFASWLGAHPATTLAAEDIDCYLDCWRERFVERYGRAPASASYRGQVNALRSFFSYLERFALLADGDGWPLPDPMRRIACPPAGRATNDWRRPAEDAALRACPGTVQERFAVALLRWSGLRLGEALALTLADLEFTPGSEALTVRRSKTVAGRRTIPLVSELQPLLAAWLEELSARQLASAATPLLATRHGTPMRASFVWRVVKRMAFRAGVRPLPCTCGARASRHARGCPRTQNGHNLSEVTPHTLRRTFGTDLLNRGLRLEVVSKLLGHASTGVTERAYAELLDDTARRELLRVLEQAA